MVDECAGRARDILVICRSRRWYFQNNGSTLLLSKSNLNFALSEASFITDTAIQTDAQHTTQTEDGKSVIRFVMLRLQHTSCSSPIEFIEAKQNDS